MASSAKKFELDSVRPVDLLLVASIAREQWRSVLDLVFQCAKMNLAEFKLSLGHAGPPEGINEMLEALWYDAKVNWGQAHQIVQSIHSPAGSWLHAYLHRKEGNQSNAAHWYSSANRTFSTVSLAEEWKQLVLEFLGSE